MTSATTPDSTSAHGLDLHYVDDAVRPQDDLFGYVNGKWLETFEIPADRPTHGAFYQLRDDSEAAVRTIIEQAATASPRPGTEAQKIGDLYASFMNEPVINELGVTPLLADITDIDRAATLDELVAIIGTQQRFGSRGFMGGFVSTDDKNSSRYILNLTQSGIGLPDESYYSDEKYADIRGKYVDHIATMLQLFDARSGDDTSQAAQRVMDLETSIAAHHWDVVARRDTEKSYNLMALDDLMTKAPGIDWLGWATAYAGSLEPLSEIVVKQPSFATGVAKVLATADLADVKLWATWSLIRSFAPYLSDDVVAENFNFYSTTLTGTESIRARWKRGVGLVEGALGEAVGKLYVAEHFPPEAKAQMQQLVDNLIEAYRRNISELEWMTPQTREKALVKLSKFTPKIGYPDQWRDYSALTIDRDDLIGNVKRSNIVDHDRDLAKLGKPIDKGEWFMTPQTVNAYYNPGMNEIVFPAAILRPPFFDPEADPAINYGGIGAVIGHEIGHGFDDQGAKYDGDGNLANWWSDTDEKEFGLRTSSLIAQYDSFTPRALDNTHHVNGSFTIGENIGDLGGLSIALVAYEIALEESGRKATDVIDGLSGLQRLFMNWATVWRSKGRKDFQIQMLAIDPHSPAEFRCNGVVANIDAFYEAFDVSPGDGLYLAPEDRVRIW